MRRFIVTDPELNTVIKKTIAASRNKFTEAVIKEFNGYACLDESVLGVQLRLSQIEDLGDGRYGFGWHGKHYQPPKGVEECG